MDNTTYIFPAPNISKLWVSELRPNIIQTAEVVGGIVVAGRIGGRKNRAEPGRWMPVVLPAFPEKTRDKLPWRMCRGNVSGTRQVLVHNTAAEVFYDQRDRMIPKSELSDIVWLTPEYVDQHDFPR
jgi:hypothetical protein